MKKKIKALSINQASLEPVIRVWAWILLSWSLYRYLFTFSEWIDEFIFKPLIFLGPVIWYVYKKEKKNLPSLGITLKNIYPALYTGLAFGMLFAAEGILANYFLYGSFNINPIPALKEYGLFSLLIISFATAVSEEVLNRGFLFNRIFEKTKNLPYAVTVATILFLLLHVPILLTTLKFQGAVLVFFFLSTLILGLINNLLFFNFRNIITPILVHVFWNMTVALYL